MVICFKVALHETDVHSAAQEQRKEKVSRVAKKTHTHINLLNESCLFFFIWVSRVVLLQISGMCGKMGYMMPNVYQESCVAACASVAPQGGV